MCIKNEEFCIKIDEFCRWGSATYRAVGQAKLALTEEQQARTTIVNTGYIGSEQAMMTKELLRCAEKVSQK